MVCGFWSFKTTELTGVLPFVASFVRGGQLVATARTTGSQNPATVACGHALAKAVAIPAFGIRWLVRALRHVLKFRAAKIGIFLYKSNIRKKFLYKCRD
jgi:hypothetical protein